MSVIISKFTDPFINLSLGTYLTKKAGLDLPSKLLFLSSSHHGVFIGLYQNCWKECHMQKMKEDLVPLVRRDTGGGACYVDRGNRLFSFIETTKNPETKKYFPIVIRALNSLELNGHTAQIQGSNDIIVGERKVSGSAFTYDGSVFRHHGTLLLQVDKEKLTSYLNPSKLKLQSKGISSVAARICNLVDINPLLTVEDLDAALISSYQKENNLLSKEITVLDPANLSSFLTDRALYENLFSRYTSTAFIYNSNPEFTHKMEHRFSFGPTEIFLSCSNNTIEKCHVFSDSLDLRWIETLESVLTGKDYKFESVNLIQQELIDRLGESYRDKAQEFSSYFITAL